ncbi:MAG: hypothetical protein K8R79_09125 [Calditrichales bacterium]|nr:hypothetical protein [Calditrichales bacterium]
MKKTFIIIFVIILGAIVFLVTPVIRDEIKWKEASSKDKASAYRSYLLVWPNGRYAGEANKNYDDLIWTEANKKNALDGFYDYLEQFRLLGHLAGTPHLGEAPHVAEATENIDSLAWENAIKSNSLESYLDYIFNFYLSKGEHKYNKYSGKYTEKAKSNIDELYWREVQAENTIKGFKHYLNDDEWFWHKPYNYVIWQHYHDIKRAIENANKNNKPFITPKHTVEAKNNINLLISDDTPFLAAQKQGTILSFIRNS